ncbi:hypothetical protein COY27_00090 [Candidatus Woesearchaeota archaeon CG_4_10_14_0_2_um_filter_33_13]|nr:MAG: hypothetical protein COY27_00090 [Candidatus Woesearchaeota archaeon CG_4_10_14_0_2_um_filter_33_13]
MEQRKLIQHGPSSLTLSLPSKWLKERKLTKGDSLFVEEEGNKLIVSTKESVKLDKISVDITELDRTSTMLYVQSLYRFGFNEMEFKFRKSTTVHYRKNQNVNFSTAIHKMVNRCIGAEVVEQHEDKVIVKSITKEAEEDFRIVLRRAFLLLKEVSFTYLEGVKNNNHSLIESVEEMHDNINKFVSYSLRLLNKYGYPDVRKTSFYCHIIASIDKIVDVIKYSARDALKYDQKFNKSSVEILEKIHVSILLYYELFYKFDFKKVNELSQNRDHIKSLIVENVKKMPTLELIYVNNMKQILEIILDLTDFRMGLEH